MKKILLSLLIPIILAAVCHADEPSTQSHAGQTDQEERPVVVPFYQDVKHNGFWWYEQEPEKKDEEKGRTDKHFLPSMKDYTTEQLWNMHPKDFQPLLDAFFDKAVQNPTEENVADYYKIQDIARSRANAFANVASLVWQKHPELNTLALDYPSNTPGKTARLKIQDREVEAKIASSSDDFAMIYFYKTGCDFCRAQNGILKFFVDKYGWQIKKVDIETAPDLAARFNVSTVPFLLLIYRHSDQSLPVAVGVTTLDEIEQRLYRGIRLLAGEITPEEFNMYEYQRGGGLDPSVYSSH
jgi:conjugal transfer pilus assembly protein TraF